MKAVKVAPPSDDKRWRVVEATMRRHGYQPNTLLETLHTTQESFGYLDEDSLRYISTVLRMPLSQVYGVATFYQSFTLKPKGAHNTCVLCTGTACHLKGMTEILQTLEETLGLKPGGMTADGKVSLMSARCLASCGMAPVAVFDGKLGSNLTPAKTVKRIQEWMADES
jgi:bidirectional [NiFe] hydrogenase diaphorase subunit